MYNNNGGDILAVKEILGHESTATTEAAINSKIGKFSKKDISNICPSISEKSVEAAIRKLVDEGYIERYGTGRNTFYAKISS